MPTPVHTKVIVHSLLNLVHFKVDQPPSLKGWSKNAQEVIMKILWEVEAKFLLHINVTIKVDFSDFNSLVTDFTQLPLQFYEMFHFVKLLSRHAELYMTHLQEIAVKYLSSNTRKIL